MTFTHFSSSVNAHFSDLPKVPTKWCIDTTQRVWEKPLRGTSPSHPGCLMVQSLFLRISKGYISPINLWSREAEEEAVRSTLRSQGRWQSIEWHCWKWLNSVQRGPQKQMHTESAQVCDRRASRTHWVKMEGRKMKRQKAEVGRMEAVLAACTPCPLPHTHADLQCECSSMRIDLLFTDHCFPFSELSKT